MPSSYTVGFIIPFQGEIEATLLERGFFNKIIFFWIVQSRFYGTGERNVDSRIFIEW